MLAVFGITFADTLFFLQITLIYLCLNAMNLVLDLIEKSAQHNKLLSWALKSRQILFENNKQLNTDERIALALGIIAAKQQLSVVIEHPAPYTSLGISAALGVLLADFFGRRTGEYGPLFSNDLIYVTRQIGTGLSKFKSVRLAGESVNGIWSAESGRSICQRMEYGSPRVIVSSPQPGHLRPYSESGSALVIDASHPLTLERISDILLDPNIQDTRIRLVIVPLGFLSQTDLFNDWNSWVWRNTEYKQKQVILDVHHHVLLSEDKGIDSYLSKARQKLGILSKYSYQDPAPHLLRAWGVYNRLASLAVSLGRYEDYTHRHRLATPIRVRLDNLVSANYAEAKQNVWLSEWPVLIESLNQAYESLKGRESGKYWALASFLSDEIEADVVSSVSIVCPTQLEANLLMRELSYVISNLHEYLHPQAISISSIKTFASQLHRPQKIVFVGAPSARWRYLNMIDSEQYQILYPHEIPLGKYTINRMITDLQERSNSSQWYSIFRDFELKAVLETDFSRSVTDQHIRFRFDVAQVTTIHPPLISTVDEDIDLYTPKWAWDAEDITFVPPLSSGNVNDEYRMVTSTTSDFVEITFHDERKITVPSNEVLDVFRRVTNELEECLAAQVEVGDVLVLVIDGNYTSIFERIIEALEIHPNYALLGVWINLWNIAKIEALESCEQSIRQLHKKLQLNGAEITEQAVRTWYSGIMAPQSDNIVFELINISENKSAIAHSKEIRRSLGHLRGMRRKVGRKLRQIIRNASVHNQPEQLINTIDELVLEDVLGAAERVVVKQIKRFT